eukprot:6190613-Amphidinium_carterae.1
MKETDETSRLRADPEKEPDMQRKTARKGKPARASGKSGVGPAKPKGRPRKNSQVMEGAELPQHPETDSHWEVHPGHLTLHPASQDDEAREDGSDLTPQQEDNINGQVHPLLIDDDTDEC